MQKCRNSDLRKSANIWENQKQNSEHLRNSASENQRTCRKTEIRKCINADLRTLTNIRENQTQSSHSASEHQRTCRKTEIRKCRNADLRKSTNICENQTQNIEHFIKEHAERQKCPSLPPPSATATITPLIFPFLPTSLLSAAILIQEFSLSNASIVYLRLSP